VSEVRTPPTRLVDLNPKWVRVHGTSEVYGIRHDCPCRAVDCPMGGWAVVPTKANFTGDPPSKDALARGWDTAGSSFEDITLSPSIHHVGHWHGWLRDGVLVSC
jgi:hypothetical protein